MRTQQKVLSIGGGTLFNPILLMMPPARVIEFSTFSSLSLSLSSLTTIIVSFVCQTYRDGEEQIEREKARKLFFLPSFSL